MSQLFEKKITHHLRRTSSDVEAKQIDHAGKADDSIDRAPVYTSIVQGLNENFQVSKNHLRLGFFFYDGPLYLYKQPIAYTRAISLKIGTHGRPNPDKHSDRISKTFDFTVTLFPLIIPVRRYIGLYGQTPYYAKSPTAATTT